MIFNLYVTKYKYHGRISLIDVDDITRPKDAFYAQANV